MIELCQISVFTASIFMVACAPHQVASSNLVVKSLATKSDEVSKLEIGSSAPTGQRDELDCHLRSNDFRHLAGGQDASLGIGPVRAIDPISRLCGSSLSR